MLATGASPKANCRADRDIEGAIGFPGQLLGLAENLPKISADGHFPPLPAGAGQVVELTLRFVVAHDFIELFDPAKGGVGCRFGVGFRRRVKDDSKRNAHLGF
jgi:hypothetical protein